MYGLFVLSMPNPMKETAVNNRHGAKIFAALRRAKPDRYGAAPWRAFSLSTVEKCKSLKGAGGVRRGQGVESFRSFSAQPHLNHKKKILMHPMAVLKYY